MFLTKITFVVSVTFCVATGPLESSSSQKFRTNSTESISRLPLVQSVRDDSVHHLQNVSQYLEPKAAVSKGDQTSQNYQSDKSPESYIRPLENKGVNGNQNKTSHDTHRTNLRRLQPDQTISFRRKGTERLRSNAPKRELPEIKVPSRRPELQQRVSWPQEQRIAAQITVQNPRVHQRKTEPKRVNQRTSEVQPQTDHQERPRLKGTATRNSSMETNIFTQLDFYRFQQPHTHGQQQKYARIQQSQPRFRASNRTPVFDIARVSSSKHLESPTRNFQNRHVSRDRYSPNAEPTDPVPSVLPATSDIVESRTTKPITFDLGFRRRIRYHRPIQNKTLRSQGIPHQGESRTRQPVRYVRPNSSSRQQNVSRSNNPDLPFKTGNESDSDWIQKPVPQQISVTSTSPATPLASTLALGKTISNITLSLQHARELFANAQEKYKALLSENSSYVGNTTTNSKPKTVEPEDQYSSSYTKIRQTDGSITRSVILSSSTTPPSSTISPTTESSSSPAGSYYNTSVSANHSSEIHSTTASKPVEEKSASKTSEHSLTTVSSNNITSQSDEATLLLDNATSTSNNVTAVPSLGRPSTENSSTLYFTTLPPPVYKNAQFDLSQFSNLQNFTPFGFGKSSQHQNLANLFQSPVSSSSSLSGSGSQSLGLSNLFGLGNIPNLGSGLGSLGGFGVGQRFSSFNTGANPVEQSGSTGLDLGYLGLLSGLSGLGLSQIGGTSSAPELSLPSIPQDTSGQQTNTGLGFLSGLPSLSLSGLGSLSSLGSLGSLPGLGGLGSNTGSPASGLSSLTGTGLSGLGLTGSGGVSGLGGIAGFGIPGSTLSSFSGSGSSTSNLGTILGKLSPTDKLAPVIGQSSGVTPGLALKTTSVEGTLAAAKTPAFSPLSDVSVLSSDTAPGDPLNK